MLGPPFQGLITNVRFISFLFSFIYLTFPAIVKYEPLAQHVQFVGLIPSFCFNNAVWAGILPSEDLVLLGTLFSVSEISDILRP